MNKEIRVYCECYEQGIYILNYISNNINLKNLKSSIIYTKPENYKKYYRVSLVSRILTHKNLDALVSIVDENNIEQPIIGIEFSTAVPTDDHNLQRYDFVYWATFFNIPCIKISPSKIKNTNMGGGSKLKLNNEYYTALKNKSVYYHIEWPLIENTDYIKTDKNFLSCPPFNKELSILLNEFVNSYFMSENIADYFNKEYNKYKKYVNDNFCENKFNLQKSVRIDFENNIIKFNRFIHGMDPERGMLLFFNQTFGKKIDIKFIIQGETEKDYIKVFGNKKAILKYINEIVLPNKDKITFDIAFNLFKYATNTNKLFENSKIYDNTIIINDTQLKLQLSKFNSVVNNLFHFGNSIILCNKKNIPILIIKWNKELVDNYYMNLKTESLKIPKTSIPIKSLSNDDIHEDMITYCCQKILKENNLENIALSYPGAQGDRKILKSNGRKSQRDYIDIISAKKSYDKYDVVIQENKIDILNSKKDTAKLNEIKDEFLTKLNELINSVFKPINIDKCYLGLGAKKSIYKSDYKIDYIILIEINNNISWEIKCINKTINMFTKLSGELLLPFPIYIIE